MGVPTPAGRQLATLDDDPGKDEHHSGDDDQVGEVLGQRERADPGLGGVDDERVLDKVEQETERHHHQAELRRSRD